VAFKSLRLITTHHDSHVLSSECLARPGEGVKIGSVCCTRECPSFVGFSGDKKFVQCSATFPKDRPGNPK
jgi:hypothetical protein